jgi:response regulator of citrate/malate metabolism
MSDLIGASEVFTYESNPDPLSVLTHVCTSNPGIVILDDDFLNPNSEGILKSIKTIKSEISVIFTTSDTSIELGRKITPLGVQYYAIKPFSDNEFHDSLESIIKLKMSKSN